MLTKKQVLSVIKKMPYKFHFTDLFDKILLINKIEEGRQKIKDGKGLSTKKSKLNLQIKNRSL